MLLITFALSVAFARIATAQVPPPPAQPTPYGALSCYLNAIDQGIDNLNAKQLCLGAPNVTPAQCFDAAQELIDIAGPEAVTLCQRATSLAPARCADRLAEETQLETGDIVTSCASASWPVVPAPGAGAPACVEAALGETMLPEYEAVRLCAGSATRAPVDCFLRGDDELTLTEGDVVDLCATYVRVAPSTAYGPFPGAPGYTPTPY